MSALAQFLRRVLAVALLVGVLAPFASAAERIPPAPKRYVIDETGTLSSGAVNAINARLEQYERDSSNQILVAMFARMETDSSVEDYTVRVAEAWHVGQKGRNNGAVLFVFKQDRQIYIQVGYGLEPTLTDAISHEIVENILKPRFRAGDFDGGVSAAVDAMIAATRGEYKGTGRTVNQARGRSSGPGGGVGALFVVMMIFFVVMRIVRGLRRGPFVLGGPRMYRRGGPNIWWGGGGGGGGWSGGGGGGFSGGGGSFGGGGAGGKW